MTEIEQEYLARSLDPDGGAFALAYAILRLSIALDGLARSFAPQGLGSFDSDYCLVRLARRLDELSTQLGAEPLAALPVINVDHHLGNQHYGAVNWVDSAAPAVGEMVYRLAQALKRTGYGEYLEGIMEERVY